MAVCLKCGTEHDGEKNYCRHCGSFLLTPQIHTLGVEGLESKGGDKSRKKLICPKCDASYEIGNYCRKCGSLLVEWTGFQETNGQTLEKKVIKRWSKEWVRLFEEKKVFETCLSKLEDQKDKVSDDFFNLMLTRYQDQLKSSSSLRREIETKLESVRKKASDEIERLGKELTPIQQRREQIESLYRSGSMTQAIFSGEKEGLKKEIEPKEKDLKKYRQILSLLPDTMGGHTASTGTVKNLLRPLPLMVVGGCLVLVLAGGYLLWHRDSSSGTSKSGEIVTTAPRGQESEKIKLLFENIRQANIKKNIGLFMSCYSHDFEDKKGKRLAVLETWENLNYLDLSYHLKKQTIAGDTADVRVEWRLRTSPKAGGQAQESSTVLDVTLSREEGNWKIKEIKSAS